MGDTNDTTTSTPRRFDTPSPEAIARAEMAANAIPENELVPIRADVMTAAAAGIGQVHALEAHRPALVAFFGDEAADALDAVVPAAHHLIMANGRFNASGDVDLEPAAAALREKRELLELTARALDGRGIQIDALRKLKGGQSYAALAEDTQTLYQWFSAHLAEVRQHCKLTVDELDAIQEQGIAFMGSVGMKACAGLGVAATNRLRAFNHFARTWDRVRKFVTYVRWHEGDYDQIAPSIYAGRTRKAPETVAAPAAPAATAPATTVAPGMPGAPAFATPTR